MAHAAVDRAKTLVARRGGWTPARDHSWWPLGLGRLLHRQTGLALAPALPLL